MVILGWKTHDGIWMPGKNWRYTVKQNRGPASTGVKHVPLITFSSKLDILSLHCPLNEKTRYIINDSTIQSMKKGVMLINTSRGGLIDTKAVH